MSLKQFWQETASAGDIPLKMAKNAIVEALSQFNRDLGVRAAKILNNPERTRIFDPDPSRDAHMMACRPKGITEDDLKRLDMYDPNHPEKWGDNFQHNTNENGKHAIIDFEYDGTPQSAIYLAHELGHAIADEIQNDSKRSVKNFSGDELEEQAYFVQNIFMKYTGQESPESQTLQEFSKDSDLKVSFDRAMQYARAEHRFDMALDETASQRNMHIINALGGITDVDHTVANNISASNPNMP